MARRSSHPGTVRRISPPIPVIFDTSVLNTINFAATAEFRLLKDLAAARVIAMRVPAMVAVEWQSQQIEDSKTAVRDVRKAVNALQRFQSLTDLAEVKALIANASREAAESINERSATAVRRLLRSANITELRFHADDAGSVMDAYGKGEPPFGSVRARADLPDAFILATVKRAAASDPRTIFVCGDTRLRDAASAAGISTVKDLKELLAVETIATRAAKPDFKDWWSKHFKSVLMALQSQEERIGAKIEPDLSSALLGTEINHQSIPADNFDATIDSVGDINNLSADWDDADSVGEGLISVPISFDAEVDLSFYVFRGNAFSVPDWVHVKLGDFEEDHVFDAWGSRTARFNARLMLRLTEEVMDKPTLIENAEASVEDVEFFGFVGTDSDPQ